MLTARGLRLSHRTNLGSKQSAWKRATGATASTCEQEKQARRNRPGLTGLCGMWKGLGLLSRGGGWKREHPSPVLYLRQLCCSCSCLHPRRQGGLELSVPPLSGDKVGKELVLRERNAPGSSAWAWGSRAASSAGSTPTPGRLQERGEGSLPAFSRACRAPTLQSEGFHGAAALLVLGVTQETKCPSSQFIPAASRLALCHAFAQTWS